MCVDKVETSISVITGLVISLSNGGLGAGPAYQPLYCLTTGSEASKVNPGTDYNISSSPPSCRGDNCIFVGAAQCLFFLKQKSRPKQEKKRHVKTKM